MRSLFFMVRHGETALNDAGNYRGWSNGPDAQLNEEGVQSAHEAAEFLLKLGQPFSRIIASPLDRTQHTAAIIAEYFGITQIQIDDRLRPLNVGSFAGKPKKDHPVQPFLKNKNLRFPDGETVNEFEKRQHDFAIDLLDWIAAEKNDSETLVVAHVSNIMYWWNVQTAANSDEYLGETSDIILPGGVAMVTEHSTVPMFRENLKMGPPINENKIDQGAALYFDAQHINRPAGSRCGNCYKFIRDGACVEVEGRIEAAKTCGLYVNGTPFPSDPRLPVLKVSQNAAGYADGDSHCESCEYFHGFDRCFRVRGFDGHENLQHIEERGCCALYNLK